MDSINNNDSFDELRLQPQQDDKFQLKSRLKRSELLNYEGTEFDEQAIAHAEGNVMSTEVEIVKEAALYHNTKLVADASIIMPDKDRLKKTNRPSAYKKLWFTLPVAAAVILAFFIIRQNLNPANDISGFSSTDLEASKHESTTFEKNTDDEQIKRIENQSINKIKDEKSEKQANSTPPTKTTAKIIGNNVDKDEKVKKYEQEGSDKNEQIPERNIRIIQPLTTQTLAVNANSEVPIIRETTQTNAVQDISVEVIEIEMPQRKSLLNKVSELIAGNKENKYTEQSWLDIKLQERVLNVNSLIGESSTVINEYNEEGRLMNTQIVSEGLEYNKQYLAVNDNTNTDTDIEVYVIENFED